MVQNIQCTVYIVIIFMYMYTYIRDIVHKHSAQTKYTVYSVHCTLLLYMHIYVYVYMYMYMNIRDNLLWYKIYSTLYVHVHCTLCIIYTCTCVYTWGTGRLTMVLKSSIHIGRLVSFIKSRGSVYFTVGRNVSINHTMYVRKHLRIHVHCAFKHTCVVYTSTHVKTFPCTCTYCT